MAEETQCRFCLSSKQTQTNPLISPCSCKGSLEFVHLKCLNRWRRQDIPRNGRQCLICLTNYTIFTTAVFEQIPETKTIILYYLQYPGLVLSLYNYLYAVILTTNKQPEVLSQYNQLYIFSHYIFHGIYFSAMYQHWNVIHTARYWRQAKRPVISVAILFHIYLFSLFHQEIYLVGPILSFVMGFYWNVHIQFLQNINDSLLDEQI